jgi:hypothetical protein
MSSTTHVDVPEECTDGFAPVFHSLRIPLECRKVDDGGRSTEGG